MVFTFPLGNAAMYENRSPYGNRRKEIGYIIQEVMAIFRNASLPDVAKPDR